jgi:predicted ferric reductase
MTAPAVTARPMPQARRRLLGALIVLAGLAFLALAASLAFLEEEGHEAGHGESPVVLAGLVCALLAAGLILMQYLLSGRLRLLDRVFGLPGLLQAHRVVAVSAAVLASCHPLLVFFPPDETIGPLRLEIWPALLGMILLASLWSTVAAGLWRGFLGLPFPRWWLLHRLGAFGLVVLAALHASFVIETFQSGLPRLGLWAILAAYGSWQIWSKLVKPARLAKAPYRVGAVRALAPDIHEVTLARADGAPVPPYAPGQFAFVRFKSAAVSSEEHHFTLSSSPARPESLSFTIKCSGDFTADIGRLAPGDTAVIDGPYGLFSHLARASDGQPLVLVAGGIGVTPFLSMLRYLADTGDTRPVTLVWSARSRRELILEEELQALQARLPGCTFIGITSRESVPGWPAGRLDREALGRFLDGVDRGAACFVCGPGKMMDAATRELAALGFTRSRIHTERFAL